MEKSLSRSTRIVRGGTRSTTTASTLAEQRDREVERSKGRKMVKQFSAKVVGVTFVPAYPDNLTALAELMKPKLLLYPMLNGEVAQEMAERDYERYVEKHGPFVPPEPLAVVLRRNPKNEYDSNAIEVHVPALGKHGMIGHLTRPIAARMAPEMDKGILWSAEVESVLIDPDHLDRPGISITCKREAS